MEYSWKNVHSWFYFLKKISNPSIQLTIFSRGEAYRTGRVIVFLTLQGLNWRRIIRRTLHGLFNVKFMVRRNTLSVLPVLYHDSHNAQNIVAFLALFNCIYTQNIIAINVRTMSTKPFLLLQKTKTNNLLQATIIVGRRFLFKFRPCSKKIRSFACTCCSVVYVCMSVW